MKSQAFSGEDTSKRTFEKQSPSLVQLIFSSLTRIFPLSVFCSCLAMLTVWLHVWQLTVASNLINRFHPNADPVLCQRFRRRHSTGSTLCWHSVLAVVPTRLRPVCRQCDKTKPLVDQTVFFNRLFIYSIESYLLDWKVQDWRCQSLIKSGGNM